MAMINDYKSAGSALECYLKGNSFSHHLDKINDELLRQNVLAEIKAHKKSGNGHLEVRIELYRAKAELEEIRTLVNYLVNELNLEEEEPECPCCEHRSPDGENN